MAVSWSLISLILKRSQSWQWKQIFCFCGFPKKKNIIWLSFEFKPLNGDDFHAPVRWSSTPWKRTETWGTRGVWERLVVEPSLSKFIQLLSVVISCIMLYMYSIVFVCLNVAAVIVGVANMMNVFVDWNGFGHIWLNGRRQRWHSTAYISSIASDQAKYPGSCNFLFGFMFLLLCNPVLQEYDLVMAKNVASKIVCFFLELWCIYASIYCKGASFLLDGQML